MIAYLIVSAIGIAYLAYLIHEAKPGYEDEHGFHFGYPPELD